MRHFERNGGLAVVVLQVVLVACSEDTASGDPEAMHAPTLDSVAADSPSPAPDAPGPALDATPDIAPPPVTAPLAPGATGTFHVTSDAAGKVGIAVEVRTPLKPRFSSGEAPIAILVPGGWDADGIKGAAGYDLSKEGFVQVAFNFPGGGTGTSLSGGTYDRRGPNCIAALRDVIRFALGAATDTTGATLSANVKTPLAKGNVGLVGLSNGGNATLTTAGLYGETLTGLSWIVNWESPVGDAMPNVEAGGKEGGVNPAYSEATGLFDYTLLAYSSTLPLLKKGGAAPQLGGFYWDLDKNGKNGAADFIPSPMDSADGKLVFYSEGLANAAVAQGIFPATKVPPHLANATATALFWSQRNGAHHLAALATKLPKLLFTVEASQEDHVQVAKNHPHVFAQYMGLRDAGLAFVRLCADKAYVDAAMGKPSDAHDNDANIALTYTTLHGLVNPETVLTNKAVTAAAEELADRVATGNLAVNLGSLITP